MTELTASLHLSEYCASNSIKNCVFLHFIGHKANQLSYGGLFQTDNGLLFHKHKWQEINKQKAAPKICAQCDYSKISIVDAKIYDSFDILTHDDYLQRYKKDLIQA